MHLPATDGRTLTITEGRSAFPKYSWCGDFCTYVLERGGIMDGNLLNRVSINGVWQIGRNISMLVEGARARNMLFAGRDAIDHFRTCAVAGDIIGISRPNGDHVGVFASRESDASYYTWDGNGIGHTTNTTHRSLGPEVFESRIIFMISLNFWFPSETPCFQSPNTGDTYTPSDDALYLGGD